MSWSIERDEEPYLAQLLKKIAYHPSQTVFDVLYYMADKDNLLSMVSPWSYLVQLEEGLYMPIKKFGYCPQWTV